MKYLLRWCGGSDPGAETESTEEGDSSTNSLFITHFTAVIHHSPKQGENTDTGLWAELLSHRGKPEHLTHDDDTTYID